MRFEVTEIGSYVGKIVLIGVSHFDRSDQLLRQQQLWGTIMGFDDHGFIAVHLEGKTLNEDDTYYAIPPQLEKAEDAAYTLRTTGEIINPDYVVSWNVYPPGTE